MPRGSSSPPSARGVPLPPLVAAHPWVVTLATRAVDRLARGDLAGALNASDEIYRCGRRRLTVFAFSGQVLDRTRAELIRSAVLSTTDDDLLRRLARLPELDQVRLVLAEPVPVHRTSLRTFTDVLIQQHALLQPEIAAGQRVFELVQSLPAELWCEVVRFLVRLPDVDGERTAYALACVCRRVRAIVLADPFVWRAVRLGRGINDFQGSRARDMFDETVRRAGDHVDEAVYLDRACQYSDPPGVWSLVGQVADKARVVSASFGGRVSSDETWAVISVDGSPLEELSLSRTRLSRRLVPPRYPFSRLVRLSLLELPFVDASSLSPILARSPLLEHLSVHRCLELYLGLPYIDGIPVVNLPRLRDLSLTLQEAYVPVVFLAPSLERVELTSMPPDTTSDVRMFLWPKDRPVNTLHVQSLEISGLYLDEVMDRLAHLPRLVRLAIAYPYLESDSDEQEADLLRVLTIGSPAALNLHSSGAVCPRLVHLELRLRTVVAGGSVLRRFIRSRTCLWPTGPVDNLRRVVLHVERMPYRTADVIVRRVSDAYVESRLGLDPTLKHVASSRPLGPKRHLRPFAGPVFY